MSRIDGHYHLPGVPRWVGSMSQIGGLWLFPCVPRWMGSYVS